MSELNDSTNDDVEQQRGRTGSNGHTNHAGNTDANAPEPMINPDVVDEAAWDIPSLEFPQVGHPLVPDMPSIPNLNHHTHHHDAAASDAAAQGGDPLGLADVADIPAEPAQPQPKADNAVTVVLEPVSQSEADAAVAATRAMAPTGTPGNGGTAVFNPLAGANGNTPTPRNPAKPPKRSHVGRNIAIVIIVLLVLAALAGGGYALWRNRQAQQEHQQAMSLCTQAKSDVDDAVKTLNAALTKGKTAQQQASGLDQTITDKLNTAIDNASNLDAADSCDASLNTDALTRNADSNTTLAGKINDAAKAVTDATKSVTDARTAKISELKQQLQTTVTTAQQLLNDSEGAVSDDTTRDTLRQAIESANAQLKESDAKLDASALQQSIDTIGAASTAVNDSMSSYTAYRQRLYQQQQQAQRQAQQQQNNTTTGGTAGSGSGTGTTTGGSTGTTTDGTGTGTGTTTGGSTGTTTGGTTTTTPQSTTDGATN
ncbi:hypothetical protein [Bifidobacterium goeldii]|nr:hypothetical protein [Bifidobacterium goeldii]